MKRRYFLLASTALAAAASTGTAMADLPKVQSLNDALRWLDKLGNSAGAKTTDGWPLVSVLDHMAQSVEMSLDGFPQPKPEIFQNTLGAAAFAVFKWRGKMSHSLTDPIPGAPALSLATDWRPASLRLRTAIERFDKHQGPLKPHFAYGNLSKADFALAHVLHIANHQDEILLG
jgi:hypothetical protein